MRRIPAAQADANFVLTGAGGIVEIQGTAETEPFREDEFVALLGPRQDGDRGVGDGAEGRAGARRGIAARAR